MARDEPISVAKSSFKCRVGAENSFTAWTIAEQADHTMELYLYKDGQGFIEWVIDLPPDEEGEEGDQMVEQIGLTFEFDAKGKRTLVDYDGVFAIPDQALDLLEAQGYDVAEMRKAMAD